MRSVIPFCLALATVAMSSAPVYGSDHDRDEHRGPPPRAEEHRAQPHGIFRGERLPVEYRHRNYVVDDWRAHRLHAPPRGYHWVQIGADFALAAIATGLIIEVVGASQPAVVAAPGPAVAAAPGGAPWYFCSSANAYYPYVTGCPEGWKVVPPPPPR